MKPTLHSFLLGLATLAAGATQLVAQGTAFTYQGNLIQAGQAANAPHDFEFRLFNAATGGAQQGPTVTLDDVGVTNGLFLAPLDFGANFPGADRFLQIAVRPGDSTGSYTTLTPRQPLTPTPYALTAGNVTGVIPGGSLAGTYPGAVTLSNPNNVVAGTFTGNGAGLTNLNAATLGSLTASNFWQTTGNAGTTPGLNFLGTSDNQALELRVANQSAFRLEPDPRPGNASANLIGGYISNRIESPGSGGSVIVGGGFAGGENIVRSNSSGVFIGGGSVNRAGPNANDVVIAGGNGNQAASFATVIGGGVQNFIQTNSAYSTIGGGVQNILRSEAATIGGGVGNTNFGFAATVAGGFYNTATNNGAAVGGGGLNVAGGFNSAVAGGNNNLALGQNGAVGGGQQNTNLGFASTISGGFQNQVTNFYGTVPGGFQNLVGGSSSFAAGSRAQALHTGSFVWADATGAAFSSGGNHEFAARASGGVRFVTEGAGMSLDDQPVLTANATNALTLLNIANTFNGNFAGTFIGNGSSLTALNASQLTSGTVPTAALGNAWKLAGNAGTTPGVDFLGTTDNQPVEFKVNGGRALRLEPTGSNSVNVLGGYSGNSIAPGKVGATIGGGGAGDYFGSLLNNQVGGDFGTVGGGARNAARPFASTIGGGYDNRIEEVGAYSVIGGGYTNVIGTNAQYAAIGGGVNNWVQGLTLDAVIAGGAGNTVGQSAHDATIGGGLQNRIHNGASFGTIAGGVSNTIAPSVAAAAIAGGYRNNIGTDSGYSAIGGGFNNNIFTNSASATIAGGAVNDIGGNSDYSTIGGGNNNNIAGTSPSSIIAGGISNDIGVNAFYSAIGGGSDNNIANGAVAATVAGGASNDVGANSQYTSIGGGYDNTILINSSYGTIPGGAFNVAASYAFAAGRRAKANHQGSFVWADSTDADFASTTTNQFRVRAVGGMEVIGGTNTVEAFKYSGSRSGGFGSPVAYGENNNTSGSSAPTLRLVGKGGNAGDGVLSVSTLGTGDLARFGNASAFVAWLTTNGTWNALAFNPTSDRAAKENFTPINPREVLEKVTALPLARWNYKAVPGAEHIGPVAQDFHAAFGLNGADDKHIATVDADGVALAAIQGLNQKLEQTHAELKRRDAENAELKNELDQLKHLVGSLAAQLNGGAR